MQQFCDRKEIAQVFATGDHQDRRKQVAFLSEQRSMELPVTPAFYEFFPGNQGTYVMAQSLNSNRLDRQQ